MDNIRNWEVDSYHQLLNWLCFGIFACKIMMLKLSNRRKWIIICYGGRRLHFLGNFTGRQSLLPHEITYFRTAKVPTFAHKSTQLSPHESPLTKLLVWHIFSLSITFMVRNFPLTWWESWHYRGAKVGSVMVHKIQSPHETMIPWSVLFGHHNMWQILATCRISFVRRIVIHIRLVPQVSYDVIYYLEIHI